MSDLQYDVNVTCPFCFETIDIRIDSTEGARQSFSYDCEVCCRPMTVTVALGGEGVVSAEARKES